MTLTAHQRQQIRQATPDTALGRIWQQHAIAALDALEAAEAVAATNQLRHRNHWCEDCQDEVDHP